MKTLIFDCGGVLVYPRMGDWNLPIGIMGILGERAKGIHTSKYLNAHRLSAGWLDEARLVPDVEEERRLRREYIRSVNIHMDWHMTHDEINRLADDFTDNIRRYGFFEDVEPWLKRWKERYRLGVLSDAMPSILKFMDEFGILGLFDATVISTQVGAIKPDPRMYAAITGALNVQPGDCLFVDDKACNLEGAERFGMLAVQMARPAFLPQEIWGGPVVDGMEGLGRFIEGLGNRE